MNGDVIDLDEACWRGEVSPSKLAEALDEHGVVRLGGALSPPWLDAMRAWVSEAITAHGEGDFYLDHADHQVGSPAQRLTCDPAVRTMLAQTAALRRPPADPTVDPMRCSMLVRAGTARTAPSNVFHYDPCVLTMVIPIFIPQAPLGTAGELAALGNTRPFRRFQATHLLDKLLTHNRAYRHHVTRRVHQNPDRYVVNLHPGDAYLFWGYRTFHGTLGCAPGLLRTTLVLKYGQVHANNTWAARMAWNLSRSRRDLQRYQSSPATPGRPRKPHPDPHLEDIHT